MAVYIPIVLSSGARIHNPFAVDGLENGVVAVAGVSKRGARIIETIVDATNTGALTRVAMVICWQKTGCGHIWKCIISQYKKKVGTSLSFNNT